MEPMLQRRILMAGQAVDGLDFLFVGDILRIKARVTRDANQLPMRGFSQHSRVHKQRDLLAFLLHRQRRIAVTRQTIFSRLGFCLHREENNYENPDKRA
jgi:hypothetical protein